MREAPPLPRMLYGLSIGLLSGVLFPSPWLTGLRYDSYLAISFVVIASSCTCAWLSLRPAGSAVQRALIILLMLPLGLAATFLGIWFSSPALVASALFLVTSFIARHELAEDFDTALRIGANVTLISFIISSNMISMALPVELAAPLARSINAVGAMLCVALAIRRHTRHRSR